MQPVTPTPEKTVGDRSLFQQALSSAGSLLTKSLIVLAMAGIFWHVRLLRDGRSPVDPYWNNTPAPLVMQGGDPYIRALMRTISAAESNSSRPYSILYGGDHIEDFSQHPDLCIPIVAGPNLGDCTTAAGRYQFITSTWLEKAEDYHPQPGGLLFWKDYSFEPEYQDRVVYAWLNDSDAWGVDLAQLLREGNLEEVLWILSPTWTSLGYGIESNSMTDSLPAIYEDMLIEELGAAEP